MIDTRTVGRTIARLRNHKGMTQQMLAAALNVSHQAVSKWENGAALPDMQTMLDLTRLFGVTMEQILTGEIDIGDEPDPIPAPEKEADAEPSAPEFAGRTIELRFDTDPIREKINEQIDRLAKDHPDILEVKREMGNAPEIILNENVKESEEVEEPEEPVEIEEPEEPAEPEEPEEDEEPEEPSEEPEDTEEEEAGEEPEEPEAPGEPEQAEQPERKLDIHKIVQMAPFLSPHALSALLMEQPLDEYSWNDIAAVAPFVGAEVLEQMIAKTKEPIEAKQIRRLAPFLGRASLGRIIKNAKDIRDMDTIASLAPFLGSDALEEMLLQSDEEITWKTLRRLAPFLRRETVDRLALRIAGIPSGARKEEKKEPPKNNNRNARPLEFGDFGDLGNKLSDLGKVISGTVQGVVETVGGAVKNIDFSNMGNMGAHPQENPAKEAAKPSPERMEIIHKIARKALADGNWEWLGANFRKVEDQELIDAILRAACKSGESEIIEMGVGRTGDQELLLTMATYLLDDSGDASSFVVHLHPDYVRKLVLHAIEIGQGDIKSMIERVEITAHFEIFEAALHAKNEEAISAIISSTNAATLLLIAGRLATSEHWDIIEENLSTFDAKSLQYLLDEAIKQSNWDMIQAIEAAIEG